MTTVEVTWSETTSDKLRFTDNFDKISRCSVLPHIDLFDIGILISLIFAMSYCSAECHVKVFTYLFIIKSKGNLIAIH